MKRTFGILASLALLSMPVTACAAEDFGWAEKEIAYCRENMIMTGDENGDLNPGGTLTRAQMSKMLVEGFDLEYDSTQGFSDVTDQAWYYDYAGAIKPYMTKPDTVFNGDEVVSREEFASTLIKAAGYSEGYLCNPYILDNNFYDFEQVSPKYKRLLSVAVERAYFRGADGYLRPQDTLKRAEVCALLYRALEVKNGNLSFSRYDLGVEETNTPLLGEAEISLESAIAWAKAHGASELFIDAAQYYWKYGELTGIRPEILYVQSAKETGYGNYGGRVLPEMNNFAGIKKYGAVNDATEDHESFETREDGVRGHFNHMSAYVGVAPIGEVHGRYNSVKTLAWAGSVKYVEDLGGRWCPDLYYGYSIVHDLLPSMYNY